MATLTIMVEADDGRAFRVEMPDFDLLLLHPKNEAEFARIAGIAAREFARSLGLYDPIAEAREKMAEFVDSYDKVSTSPGGITWVK